MQRDDEWNERRMGYLRARMFGRDPHCAYCGVLTVWTVSGKAKLKSATLDHVIPSSLGGTSDVENLVLTCYRCNRDRANLSVVDFLSKKYPPGTQAPVSRAAAARAVVKPVAPRVVLPKTPKRVPGPSAPVLKVAPRPEKVVDRADLFRPAVLFPPSPTPKKKKPKPKRDKTWKWVCRRMRSEGGQA